MQSATITITRNDEDIEVTVEGRFYFQTSYDPRECGVNLDDWDVIEPKGVELTDDEQDRAVQALYDAHDGE